MAKRFTLHVWHGKETVYLTEGRTLTECKRDFADCLQYMKETKKSGLAAYVKLLDYPAPKALGESGINV